MQYVDTEWDPVGKGESAIKYIMIISKIAKCELDKSILSQLTFLNLCQYCGYKICSCF